MNIKSILPQKKLNRMFAMEQRPLKKCLNANINSYLETSGGQGSNLYLNVVHFFNKC